MKPYFSPAAIVVKDNLDGTWTLIEPLGYTAADGEKIDVRAGFLTDFGSIPQVLWSIPGLCGSGSNADPAYVLHDWLYCRHRDGTDTRRTRSEADALLLEALEVCGVPRFRRWTIYLGVRAGGWIAWKGATK